MGKLRRLEEITQLMDGLELAGFLKLAESEAQKRLLIPKTPQHPDCEHQLIVGELFEDF